MAAMHTKQKIKTTPPKIRWRKPLSTEMGPPAAGLAAGLAATIATDTTSVGQPQAGEGVWTYPDHHSSDKHVYSAEMGRGGWLWARNHLSSGSGLMKPEVCYLWGIWPSCCDGVRQPEQGNILSGSAFDAQGVPLPSLLLCQPRAIRWHQRLEERKGAEGVSDLKKVVCRHVCETARRSAYLSACMSAGCFASLRSSSKQLTRSAGAAVLVLCRFALFWTSCEAV